MTSSESIPPRPPQRSARGLPWLHGAAPGHLPGAGAGAPIGATERDSAGRLSGGFGKNYSICEPMAAVED